jgi:hypothetical protein
MNGGWVVRVFRPRAGSAKTIIIVAIEDPDEALAAVQELVGQSYSVELGTRVDTTHLVSRGIRPREIRVLGSRPWNKRASPDAASPDD